MMMIATGVTPREEVIIVPIDLSLYAPMSMVLRREKTTTLVEDACPETADIIGRRGGTAVQHTIRE
jgi:hypothetical protein